MRITDFWDLTPCSLVDVYRLSPDEFEGRMYLLNEDEFVPEHMPPHLRRHHSFTSKYIKAIQLYLRFNKQQSFVYLVLCLYRAAAMFAREHAVGLYTIQFDVGRYWAYISTQFMVVMQRSVYCVSQRVVSFNLVICFPLCRDIHTGHT
jgi:hypothetical protein